MRTTPLPADFIYARTCKLKCEKFLTRPKYLPLKPQISEGGIHVSGCFQWFSLLWQLGFKVGSDLLR